MSRIKSNQLLKRTDAATYVVETHRQPCSRSTLAHLAISGDGPTFQYIGRFPYYFTHDLDTWALGRIGAPIRSTKERLRMPARRHASIQRECKK